MSRECNDCEIELKPCLFCGAEAKICKSPLGYFVECVPLGHLHNSGVFSPLLYLTPQKAAEAWNRRAKENDAT